MTVINFALSAVINDRSFLAEIQKVFKYLKTFYIKVSKNIIRKRKIS